MRRAFVITASCYTTIDHQPPPSLLQSLHGGETPAPPSQHYEASLRPDTVYGLGMRLEKREHDILVASFKARISYV